MNPEVQRLLDRLEPQIRDAFLEAIARVQSQAQLRLIVTAIEAGDLASAARLLQVDASMFALLDKSILDAFWAGGLMALANTPRVANPFSVPPSPLGSTGGMSGRKSGRGRGPGI